MDFDLNKYIDLWQKMEEEELANLKANTLKPQDSLNDDDEFGFGTTEPLILTESERKNPKVLMDKIEEHYNKCLYNKVNGINEVKKNQSNNLNEVKKNIKSNVETMFKADNPVSFDNVGQDQDDETLYKNDGGPHYDTATLEKIAEIKVKIHEVESDFSVKFANNESDAKLNSIQKKLEALRKELDDLSI